MKLLIVSALPRENSAAQAAVERFRNAVSECKILYAQEMKISPCVGCNACWLKTPGICAVKDDYEEILKGFIEYGSVVFLAGTALNFVDHRMKNIIDRMLPLVTMGIRIVDGQCRHVPRYDRRYRLALLYDGTADQQYLEEWMGRVALNFDGESLGVFPIDQAEEALSCIL